MGIDLLWPVFLLAGLEQVRFDAGLTAFSPFDFVSYPWSHSLLMVLVWALVVGAWVWGRGDRRAAAWCGVLVISHWVLDSADSPAGDLRRAARGQHGGNRVTIPFASPHCG